MQTFTSIEYVAIAIANAYGLDKQNYEDRLLWVWVHEEELESFRDAEDQFAYDKAVKELRKVQKGEPTGLIVKFDACASGAQLLSVMTGCRSGCEATNAIGNQRNNPYMMVRDAMQEALGTEIEVSYSDCKKAVMTSLYGSTATPKRVFGSHLDAFYKAVDKVFTGAYEVMPFLMNSWQNTPVHEWVMPDGFQVRKPNFVAYITDVHLPSLDYEMKVRYYEVEAQKKGLSMAADITHSVDSYLLRSLVRHCSYDPEQVRKWICKVEAEMHKRENISQEDVSYPDITMVNRLEELSTGELVSLYLDLNDMLLHKPFEVVTVHDCFGCHPNNVNRLRYWYNQLLARLNRMKLLENILAQLGTNIIIEGEDLYEEILDNSYAIC